MRYLDNANSNRSNQCSRKRVQQQKNVKSHVFWILKKTFKTLKNVRIVSQAT